MSRLLINERPLMVLPNLACAIGLNEAIVLQQIHYWLDKQQHFHDGHYWTYNTMENWQKQFPFWSLSTLKRTINSLRSQELVITTNAYNKMEMDKTLWYTINYEKLGLIEEEHFQSMNPPSGQNEPMDFNAGSPMDVPLVQNEQMRSTTENRMNLPLGQNDPSSGSKWTEEQFNMTQAIPKSTTKTTTKSNTDIKDKSPKRKKRVYELDSLEMRMTIKFESLIQKNDEKFKVTNPQMWCNHFRLMMEQDGRTPQEILDAMTFAQNDGFWQSNILSADKLRKQMTKLLIQHKQKESGQTRQSYSKYQESAMKEIPKWVDHEAREMRAYEQRRKDELSASVPTDEELQQLLAETRR